MSGALRAEAHGGLTRALPVSHLLPWVLPCNAHLFPRRTSQKPKTTVGLRRTSVFVLALQRHARAPTHSARSLRARAVTMYGKHYDEEHETTSVKGKDKEKEYEDFLFGDAPDKSSASAGASASQGAA